MKPASIVSFGRIWLLSILLAIGATWISRGRVQAMLEANPRSAPVAHWALPGLTGFAVLLCLLLWYLVLRRSLTAKWGVLIVALLWVPRALVSLLNFVQSGFRHPVSTLTVIAAAIAAIVATALLFRPDARQWFGEDGVDDEAGYPDPDMPA